VADALRCQALLFDLDGVLMDSGAAVERTWERWSARHGLDLATILAQAHGRRSADTVRAVAPWLDAEAEAEAIEADESEDVDGVVALPGAASLLRALPAGRWAVATSGSRRLATRRLGHGRLPVPEVLVTADDVTHGKPHPEPYLAAARALGADPARCVVVEDAPAGIAAARAAGASVLGLATTFTAAELREADRVVPSLAAVRYRPAAGDELELVLEE
jgi:mannitol-1-/sugar-/sorbitol-6-phosphatase